jgi:type II secretory pathway component GspD/PulD (secretin)
MRLIKIILLSALSIILSFNFIPAQDEDFISVSPVEKKATGDLIEQEAVKKIEKAATPVSAKVEKLANVEKVIATDLKDKIKIQIVTSKNIEYKATELSPPPNYRILVQLTKCGVKSETIKVEKSNVINIRTAPHDSTAWVVIDLKNRAKWKATNENNRIIIDVLKSEEVTEVSTQIQTPAYKKTDGIIYRIVDVSGKDLKKKHRIIITTDGPVKYKIKKDEKAKKLILNLINAISVYGKNKLVLSDGVVDTVEINEDGKNKSVDVVLQLKENSPYTVVRDLNQIVIDVENVSVGKARAKKKLDLYQKISLNIQNASLPSVLRLLSTQTGFEFTLGPSVSTSQTITMRKEQEPFIDVLRDILIPMGLYYEIKETAIKIGSVAELKQAKQLLPKVTKFYTPKTMKVDDLDRLLKVQMSKDAFIDVATEKDTAEGKNRLMIVGTEEDVDKVMDMIANIDVPEQGYSGDEEEGGTGIKTKVFRLKYIRLQPGDSVESSVVESINSTIQSLLSSDGKYTLDTRTSSYIVTDRIKNLKKIEKVLKSLDVKVPQVNIEAKLYEINRSAVKNMGVNWNAISQNKEPFIRGDVTANFLPGTGSLNIGTLQNGFNITAYLNALENQNKAQLLSAPQITVSENKPAEITTKRATYYQTSSIVTSQTGPPVVTTQYVQVELPITLSVRPKITPNGRIELYIKITVTQLTGATTSTNAPPETSTQEATTYVDSANDETIVIGGLINNRIVETEDKVPILGDLPLLGMIFKGTRQENQNNEIVVFLTPSIVEE